MIDKIIGYDEDNNAIYYSDINPYVNYIGEEKEDGKIILYK